ncbi:hypothetical protein [Kribbella lupini]|uniref:Beta/gamma crystallin n=1 Tax=Kribbella lupini TaxID=291602 RepID=A0ABP4MGS2_9ACTN
MMILRRTALSLTACALLSAGFTATAEAATDATEGAVQVTKLNACVNLISWRNSSSTRYVTAKNTCISTQCYRVEQKYIGDPLVSIPGNRTQEDAYSSTFFGQGIRIYGVSCD